MELKGKIQAKKTISGCLSTNGNLNGNIKLPGVRYETDYNCLTNKPKINSIELVGDKTFSDLGMEMATALDILNIFEED